jgi:putative hydrolase of the HAD superfamily
MQVDAVLFDLFNTLILLEGDEAFYMPSLKKLHDFLVKNNISISFEDFTRTYFEVRDKLYLKTSKSLEDPHFNLRVAQTLEKLGYRLKTSDPIVAAATDAFSEEFMKYAHPDKDALYVLKRLHGKYKLGIVSNLSIPECVSKLLPKFGLDRFFETIVISGAVNKRKPSPEIFRKALKTLNVQASNTVFVGDTLNIDIKGAKDVGLKAILIQRPTPKESSVSLVYKPSEEDTIKPDDIIKSLRELPSLIEEY